MVKNLEKIMQISKHGNLCKSLFALQRKHHSMWQKTLGGGIHIICSYLRCTHLRTFRYGHVVSLLHRITNVVLKFHIVNYFILCRKKKKRREKLEQFVKMLLVFSVLIHLSTSAIINFHSNMFFSFETATTKFPKQFSLVSRNEDRSKISTATLSRNMAINFWGFSFF